MGFLRKAGLAGVLASAAISLAPAAQAAVVIQPVATGPFSLANPTGTITAFRASTSNSYYFPFQIIGPVGMLSQMQASLFGPVVKDVQFSLFSGTCTTTCTGAFIDQSALEHGAALFDPVGSGDYYLRLDSFGGVDGALVSGGLTLEAVPEPATWGLMMVGLAGLGATLRMRRRTAMAAA